MKEEWQAVSHHQQVVEKAERLGFKIQLGNEYKVELVAQKESYSIGCIVDWFNTFKEVSSWLDGYAQHAFELKNTVKDKVNE